MDNKVKLGCLTQCKYFKIAQLFFVCETMHVPLKCREMLPLEIWNGIISTFWCNRHDDIHAPQCDHRHWMLVNMQRAPPGVIPGFSDPTEDTAVPR